MRDIYKCGDSLNLQLEYINFVALFLLSAMVAKVLHLTLLLGVVAVTSVIGQRNIALSGPEIELLRLGQNPELLELAALTLESVIIVIEDPEVVAVVQENVNANFWCLPWLYRSFPEDRSDGCSRGEM